MEDGKKSQIDCGAQHSIIRTEGNMGHTDCDAGLYLLLSF